MARPVWTPTDAQRRQAETIAADGTAPISYVGDPALVITHGSEFGSTIGSNHGPRGVAGRSWIGGGISVAPARPRWSSSGLENAAGKGPGASKRAGKVER